MDMMHPSVQKQNGVMDEQPGLSEIELDEIHEVFKLFDTNNSGSIDRKELHAAMQNLCCDDMNHNTEESEDLTAENSGSITFEEFRDMMITNMGHTDSKRYLQKVFHLFDHDQTGKISLRNLKRVVKDLGETITDAELLEMIERADINQDGEIDVEEFYAIMTKKTHM